MTAPEPGRRACVLVGPTAAGKTEVAHQLAAASGARILSADSMLVYRGMDIGTAKPAVAERRRFHYGGVDLAAPDQACSAGDYLRAARAYALGLPTGAELLVVGGTGLYVQGLLAGLDDLPAADPALRRELEALQAAGGVAALQDELRRLDAGRLARLADPANPRRLLRALELVRLGAPPPGPGRRAEAVIVGLRPQAAWLGERIRRRTEAMFRNGLLDEVAGLLRTHGALSPTAAQAIGYAEAQAVLAGALSVAAARERVLIRTRQLAKRQMTWFRRQANVAWIDIAAGDDAAGIAARVAACWEEHGSTRLSI